eukprot:4247728-Prymnesium_polylepis.2
MAPWPSDYAIVYNYFERGRQRSTERKLSILESYEHFLRSAEVVGVAHLLVNATALSIRSPWQKLRHALAIVEQGRDVLM